VEAVNADMFQAIVRAAVIVVLHVQDLIFDMQCRHQKKTNWCQYLRTHAR
jgi:hypothetical protein